MYESMGDIMYPFCIIKKRGPIDTCVLESNGNDPEKG